MFDDATQLDGVNFSGAKLLDKIHLPKHLKDANFSSTHFSLNQDTLAGRTFENCNFEKAYLRHMNFDGSVFKGGSLKEASLSFNKIKNVTFEGVNFGAYIDYAHFENVTFKDMKSGVDFTKAELNGVKFEGSLKGITLRQEQLKHVDFSKADTAGLRVVNFFGEEVKNPFGKGKGGSGGKAAGGGVQAVEEEAGKARSFVDAILRNSEGKIHGGKVAGLVAGTLATGAAVYYVVNRNKDESWQERVTSRKDDDSLKHGV